MATCFGLRNCRTRTSPSTASTRKEATATTGHDADHVFVWIHHPPDADVPLTNDPVYAAEWRR